MEVLYALPVLFSCVISITGLTLEERQHISQLISNNGGVFTADLHTRCTHLIVSPTVLQLSRRASPKFVYAHKWGILTVSPDWLYESLTRRTCLDPLPFLISPSESMTPLAATPGGKPQYTQNFLYDDLSAEDIGAVPLPPYLEGLHIFVGDQLAPERLAIIKRLVLAAGGTRYADLYDPSLITHYIVHNQTLTGRDLELLRQFDGSHSRPLLVHDQWLFACFQAKERVLVTPFIVPDRHREIVKEGGIDNDGNGSTTLSTPTDKISRWSLKPSLHPQVQVLQNISTSPGQISLNTLPSDWSFSKEQIPQDADLPSGILPLDNPQAQALSTAAPLSDLPLSNHRTQALQNTAPLSGPPPNNPQAPVAPTTPRISQLTTTISTPLDGSRPSVAPPFHLPTFAGITFRVLAFSTIALAQVVDLIEKNGGTIQSLDQEHVADYTVAPLIIGDTLIVNPHPLNELWLEACVVQGRLVDPLLSPYYVSMAVPESVTGFDRLCISLTGYFGLERDYFARLATALGASYTENLSKKNNLLMATLDHTGPKIDFAVKNGISVVSGDWLVASARVGHPLTKKNISSATTLLRDNDEENVAVHDSNVAVHDSNVSVYNSNVASMSAKRDHPENSDSNSNAPPDSKTVKRFCKMVSPRITALPLSPEEAVPFQPPSNIHRLLAGNIFAISQRLWHRREEMHDLVTEMGGIFVWSYDDSSTHYIHQGNMLEEGFREFCAVRRAGKWIISPHWLTECRQAGRKLREADYPHTYKPGQEATAFSGKDEETPPLTSNPEAGSMAPPDYSLDDFKEALQAATNNTRLVKKSNISYSHSPLHRPASTVPVNVGPKEISFSALSATLRSTLPAALEALSVTLDPPVIIHGATPNWEPTTTHLVIGSLSKSEKFLCACAAGVWVLRPEWGETAMRQKRFPPEIAYEWQLPSAQEEQGGGGKNGGETKALTNAPRHWREHKMRTGTGAFAKWSVLLVADQKRLPSLRAILRAGGATVYGLSDLPSEQNATILNDLTHALVSSTLMGAKIPADVQERLIDKIHLVDLIAEHLINFDK